MSSTVQKSSLQTIREQLRDAHLADEAVAVKQLIAELNLDAQARTAIGTRAAGWVEDMRTNKRPGMMETFLAEYGMSTKEGVALMCLAEALLRVPDDLTIDALIRDKIGSADWGRHLGHSGSPLVNASTWTLMLTGKVIESGPNAQFDVLKTVRALVKRAGEPVIRKAVGQAMRVMGHQFVLGRDIGEATDRAKTRERQGYAYSYDMLGEAARTSADAQRYFMAYSKAITMLAERCGDRDIRDNPGVSVKLSALHPRYEYSQRQRAMDELAPRVTSLALIAKNANMGFNIDAEEMNRLDLSLDVIERVLSNPDLKSWDGLGVVVQSYSPRACFVIDWLYELATRLDRKLMVRLVKGAYWDTEIKEAQVQGLDGYPVFTRKIATDINYIACAKRLFRMTDRFYPQFATHNAHTAAAVMHLADKQRGFEFQRLHGMGEALYELIREQFDIRCRIYAPVGIHEDLLAYLVRRLLENGANSSFVHQILDPSTPASEVVRDPLDVMEGLADIPNPHIPMPKDIFGTRLNSKGTDLTSPTTIARLDAERERFASHRWKAGPKTTDASGIGPSRPLTNPAHPRDCVGDVTDTDDAAVELALSRAKTGAANWSRRQVNERAAALERIADLYEKHTPELMALATREAGKTVLDGVAEVREAVDFCRYYASEARTVFLDSSREPRGVFLCISPWNFPLAIFTGQIVAALVAGNSVIAKPAEQTPLLAARAVDLMHEAGIAEDALQLLPGDGTTVGGRLTRDPRIDGICFTGSVETAQAINRAMASHGNAKAPLIAETGGLNAMIVDSSALPEQAVRDIVASAFQSAGQRCSATRVLFVQEDISEKLLTMLIGALRELRIGDPWKLETDVGPVIDAAAKADIESHCATLEAEGRLLAKANVDPALEGTFAAPAIFRLHSLHELKREVFGPVLHVVTFPSGGMDEVVRAINDSGYGLTMGLHTRVDERVQAVTDHAQVGNMYVNRNQIGAVVGAQPFGGEGLSGTGPKAGGPNYLYRFSRKTAGAELDDMTTEDTLGDTDGGANPAACVLEATVAQAAWQATANRIARLEAIQISDDGLRRAVAAALLELQTYGQETVDLPGPTGESNRLSLSGRGVVLCVHDKGAAAEFVAYQVVLALATGNSVVLASAGERLRQFADALTAGLGVENALVHMRTQVPAEQGAAEPDIAVLVAGPDAKALAKARLALAERPGPIIPLVAEWNDWRVFATERALCIDTTASGGNTTLLTSAGG